MRFWIPFRDEPDFLPARSEAVIAVTKAFDAKDVTIPFAIRTLDLGIEGGEKLEDALPRALAARRANGRAPAAPA